MHKNIHVANSLTELKNTYGEYPIVVIKHGKDEDSFKEVADLFGGAINTSAFGEIRKLVVNNNTLNQSVGSSNSAHPPHTDGVYNENIVPSFMLQCVQNDDSGGGKGLFWNIPDLFKDMPSKYRDFLSQDHFYYSRLREDGKTLDKFKGSIIFKYKGKLAFRWRYDLRVRPRFNGNSTKEQDRLFHDSVTWMLTYLLQNPPEIYEYSIGDIIICDNIHVLHGRTKIFSSKRFMRRCWLDYSI